MARNLQMGGPQKPCGLDQGQLPRCPQACGAGESSSGCLPRGSSALVQRCDARIHAANRVASRHERVRVCEACEHAPAAFICKADAASLCTACDADIHSANLLARRHHRVPIVPILGKLYGPPSTDPRESVLEPADETIDEDEDEAASWLLLNPVKNNSIQNEIVFLFGSRDVDDEYLDIAEYETCQENHFTDQFINQQQKYSNGPEKSYGGDSVVPVQSGEAKGQLLQHKHFRNYQLGMEYQTKDGYGYPASICHNVSMSSMDVGIVPESSTSDVSISHPRPPKGTIDLFSSPPVHMPSQLTPMDREAKVLRYREKKKARKFEKTIRYASRKAYAETRPRIKGRFAKRTDVEIEVDQMFSTTIMAEGSYGIVPSF